MHLDSASAWCWLFVCTGTVALILVIVHLVHLLGTRWKVSLFYCWLGALAVWGGALAFLLPIALNSGFGKDQDGSGLRQALLYATGGVLAVITLGETHRKNSQEKEKNENDHIRQVHAERRSRYTTAVEQLANEKAPVRLGGIYTLTGLVDEWLADDSLTKEKQQEEGQVIINNLCSYIRSPFPLAEKREVLEKDQVPDDYDGSFTADRAQLRGEQDIRRAIFEEMSKRSSTVTVDENEEVTVTPGAWSGFKFNFSRTPIFYPLNNLTIEQGDFSSARFYGEADFRGAKFAGDADFGNTEFTGDAGFSKAEFTGNADFRNAEFTGNVHFWEAKFTGNVYLRNAKFTGNTYFGDTYFRGAKFTGDAYFMGTEFTGDAYFMGTEFTGDAYFMGAEFTGNAYFGNAYFGGAKFTGNAYFGGAKFTRDADFGNTKFTRDADFGNTKFTGNADFGGAKFTGIIHFLGAKFTGNAHFIGAEFTEDADFGNAEFTRDADFGNTKFTGNAHFIGAEFTGNAHFIGAKFTGIVYFMGAKFTGNADFRNAEFTRVAYFLGVEFTGSTGFNGAYFEKSAPTFADASGAARFSTQVDPQDYVFSVMQGSKRIKCGTATLLGKSFIIPLGTVLFDPSSRDKNTRTSEPAKPLDESNNLKDDTPE